MRELTSIEFVFDSCHKIDIPIKYFGYVNIDGIRDVTKRYAMNCVATVKQASVVEFVIFKEADSEEDCPNVCTIFERFQMARDITHIFLHYEDGSEDKLYVEMKGLKDNWLENEYEHIFVSDAGDLYLTVGKDITTADINKDFPVLHAEVEQLRRNICTGAKMEIAHA